MATALVSLFSFPVGLLRLRERIVPAAKADHLAEAQLLCRKGHYAAAASMAKAAIDNAMSDLALAAQPTLRRFHNGKRLMGFLRSVGRLDGKLCNDLTQHNHRTYELIHHPTGRRFEVSRLIAETEALCRTLRTLQLVK